MRKIYFLLFLPFFLLSPCHGSSTDFPGLFEGMESRQIKYLATNKFICQFVAENARDAQTWEECLEGIFTSCAPGGALCDKELEDFIGTWLSHSQNAFARRNAQGVPEPIHVSAQDISHDLQKKIYRFTKAQEILQMFFQTQWNTWTKSLHSQDETHFVQAFAQTYPDALPQRFEEFPSAIGDVPAKQQCKDLIPHMLIRTTACESLKGLESARYLMQEDCGFAGEASTAPALKVAHMEEMSSLDDLRFLFLVRSPLFFSKKADPWPLLATLGKMLPSLKNLRTLQLPVLFAEEEAAARELLAGCGSLNQLILSRFMEGQPAITDVPLLDPESLFDAVPEGVKTFLREESTHDEGLWTTMPAQGGVYPYASHTKSPRRVAPCLEKLTEWGVKITLITMVQEELNKK